MKGKQVLLDDGKLSTGVLCATRAIFLYNCCEKVFSLCCCTHLSSNSEAGYAPTLDKYTDVAGKYRGKLLNERLSGDRGRYFVCTGHQIPSQTYEHKPMQGLFDTSVVDNFKNDERINKRGKISPSTKHSGESRFRLVQNCRVSEKSIMNVVPFTRNTCMPWKELENSSIDCDATAVSCDLSWTFTTSDHLNTPSNHFSEHEDPQSTLILTPLPGTNTRSPLHERKTREICFINIQQKLLDRGVSLQDQYPDVYRRLSAYTEGSEDFAPVGLFPIHPKTGKRFLCVIMPKSEPESTWFEEIMSELRKETIV